MSICPDYKVEIKSHTSNPINGVPKTYTDRFPWCNHESSTVSFIKATSMGGEKLLKCDGDLTKCILHK